MDLAHRGCEALDYRLTGDVVEHLCVRHLYGRHRAIVCFPGEDEAVILLVAEHLKADDPVNIYALLYRLLELKGPMEPRTKPPCCDEQSGPPLETELLERLEAGLKELGSLRDAQGRQRRRPRRRR